MVVTKRGTVFHAPKSWSSAGFFREVPAERPGPDGAPEPGAELGVLLRDAIDRVLDPALHRGARAIDGRGGASRAAAAPGRARQLLRDRLHLLARSRRAFRVADRVGVLDRVAQRLEARAIRAERRAVEHLAGVAAVGVIARADELEDVDVDARALDQPREVVH